MSDHKATRKQWSVIGTLADRGLSEPSCILELAHRLRELESSSYADSLSRHACFDALVTRIEKLERSNQALHATTLKLANAIVGSPEKRRSLFTDLIADEDDSKPAPNSDQIRSSVKAQALSDLDNLCADLRTLRFGSYTGNIRKALEQLSDD